MKQSTPSALAFLDAALSDAEAHGLLRQRRPPPDPAVLSFCSNDYLGLAARLPPPEASGAGASRLVDGERAVHARVEKAAADWVGQPDSLAFVSGYAANTGLLAALAGPGDLIVSDALNHASLIDGARLSRAEIVVVPHLDVTAVAHALGHSRRRRTFVVTESYFSMDADSPDLGALRELCDRSGAALIVDEAHALGVLGQAGRGLCADARIVPDATIGTFGKAFGASGAFVAGSRTLTQWLWNRARPFVFSTGMSPVVAAAALDGLRVARQEPGRRERVLAAASRFREGMRLLGLQVQGFGPVMPWIVGDPREAMRAAAHLQAQGIDVRAIRPPSVPPGTARLRFTVTANHHPGDVDRALDAVASLVGRSARRVSPGLPDAGGVSRTSPATARVPRSATARLMVVAGTGTGIGKTHVADALLRAWNAAEPALRILGVKPIESGVSASTASDAERLASATPFHVKHFRYSLTAPVSPHLAARDEGVAIDIAALTETVAALREQADVVILELAGGLFTPLAPGVSNAEFAAALAADTLLLVAPDRLGVLHDVSAAVRAAATLPVAVDGVVLVAPSEADPSTTRNAAEIRSLLGVPVLATIPRGSPADLARLPQVGELLDLLRSL